MRWLGWVAAGWLAAWPVSAAAGDVDVEVRNVASSKGNLMVVLCTEAEFLKDCALKAMKKAQRGPMSVRFKQAKPGRYAAMVYHDENGDRKMARGPMGIPAEGWGMSGDAAGQPRFQDAAVTIGAPGARISIVLAY
jgi:uncharacterized protein (DUF2141 family)